jgi:putative membrane protein
LFLLKQALDEGVKSGKYYAGIYLPKDFSKDLLSFTSGEITKPKIVYSINEKINAIAPKITEKERLHYSRKFQRSLLKLPAAPYSCF